jgi:hypothetical protein
MTKVILIATAVLVLAACQEEYEGLYVNSSCSQREYELVEQAINKLNDILGDDYIGYQVDLAGWDRPARHPDNIDITNDGKDVVYCLSSPTYRGDDNTLGMSTKYDILVMSYKIKSEKELLFDIMHELVHHIGIEEHVSHSGDIMSEGITYPPPQSYTDADIEFILKNLK